MIIVQNGNQIEPLVQFNKFELTQEVKGSLAVSFTSFNVQNNPAHRILLEESIVTINEFDFRVKQLKDSKTQKSVVALSTYFDLADKRQNSIYGGTRTFNEFMSFALSGTGWTFTTDVSGSRLIENFGENNVVILVNAICQSFNCEYEIRPNNHIHFSKQIGGSYDAQYRYRHNIKALAKSVDTTRLKTYVEGHGANGLFVSYESTSSITFGKREAEPIYDEQFFDANSLLEHIKLQLIDYPEISFELDSIELLDKELGERVWLIYEPLEIEFETRILAQTKSFINGKLRTVKVTLGNTIPRTGDDLLVDQKIEIDENRQEYRSKFEQTNDRITLEVEEVNKSIAAIDIKADNINLSVNNRITNEMSQINLRADGIQLEVNRNEKEIGRIDIKADNINLSVNNRITSEMAAINLKADNINLSVNNRITNEVAAIDIRANQIELSVSNLASNTSSSITQLSNNINLKVDKGGTITDINISPGYVLINADKIQFQGQIFGQGATFSGDISTSQDIFVGNNIYLAPNGGGSKSLIFDGAARIVGDWSNINISAPNLHLDGSVTIGHSGGSVDFNGNVNFAYANSITGVARANSSGIGISTSGGILYVQVNGSTIGQVKLT